MKTYTMPGNYVLPNNTTLHNDILLVTSNVGSDMISFVKFNGLFSQIPFILLSLLH